MAKIRMKLAESVSVETDPVDAVEKINWSTLHIDNVDDENDIVQKNIRAALGKHVDSVCVLVVNNVHAQLSPPKGEKLGDLICSKGKTINSESGPSFSVTTFGYEIGGVKLCLIRSVTHVWDHSYIQFVILRASK